MPSLLLSYPFAVNTHDLLTLHPPPDSKIHGANVGPNWDRTDPGGPHVGLMNFAILANAVVVPIVTVAITLSAIAVPKASDY